MMFADGSIAVALVKNQVMIVQGDSRLLMVYPLSTTDLDGIAARTHTKREKYLDVHTYTPFGERVFLASDIPSARISSSDLLKVLPLEDNRLVTQGMLELPKKAYSQYMELNSRHQKRYESLWSAWVSKH